MTSEDAAGKAVVPIATGIVPPGAGSFYDATGKSPEEIEEDINETRTQLGDTLDELERRLAPRHLLEKGVDMLKETMSGNSGRIGETLRGSPVPLALIGLGVGWMLLSGTGKTRKLGELGGDLGERVSGTVRGVGQRAGEFAGQVKDRVLGAAPSYPAQAPGEPMAGYAYARQKPDQIIGSQSSSAAARASATASVAARRARDTARRVQEAGGAAAERAGAYAQYTGDQLASARERMATLIDEHPLAVGALGFLAGAVVALMLPRSRAEERWVAPVGEQLREHAEHLGREAIDRAQTVAERAADAAVDAVKEVVSDTAAASEKSEKKADTAGGGASAKDTAA